MSIFWFINKAIFFFFFLERARGRFGGTIGVNKKGAAEKYQEAAIKFGQADDLIRMSTSYLKGAEVYKHLKE